MKVYQGLDNFIKLSYAVVTSGTFDGVHIGHQKILARLQEIAQLYNGETVVITYWPHPRLIVSTDSADLKLLSTIDEKIELLEKYGVDHLIIIPFTREFSQLSSEEFIINILVEQIGTRKLVIGYDHRFGKNREGSFEHLKQNAPAYGFEVEEIPRQDIDDVGVSSTRIRMP
jgi:riboflavin kinase/FMN adenylyltransferase